MKKYLSNVRVDLLNGDKGYQRRLRPEWIENKSKDFKPEQLGVLIVSKRPDGKHYVIDGQNRLELLKKVGIAFAPCLVMEGLTPQQESALFVTYEEESVAINPIDKFRAKVHSGDSHLTQISEILKKNHLQMELDGNEANHIRIRCIVSVSKMAEVYGYEILDQALSLIKSIWPKDKHATEKHFIEAIAKFVFTFNKNRNFNLSRTQQQFKMIVPYDMVMRAKGMKLSGRVVENIVDMLIDTYNQRLHTNNRLYKH